MPRVLLLLPTTTYRTQAFMDAARRLGVQVTAASEEASTLTKLNPTGLLTLNFSEPQQAARRALEFSAEHPIDAVVAVDDQVAAVGAAIANALGLPSNSIESALAARDKHLMRQLLARSGVRQPQFRICSFKMDVDQLAREVPYPCVVKPLTLAGSRGVIRANTEDEFKKAVARLAGIMRAELGKVGSRQSAVGGQQLTTEDCRVSTANFQDDTHHFLVEDFIPGLEVAVEGLLTRGRLQVLAIFDKPDPLDGPFFEETTYVTPSRLPEGVQQEIARCTAQACQAIGLVHGPVHAELRLSPTYHSPTTTHHSLFPSIIEVNPRSIGGLCSRVLRFGTGLSLEELIIRQALDPDFIPPTREGQAAGVMMIPIPRAGVLREVRGIDAAKSVSGIEDVTISARVGQELIPLPEGSPYPGFIFARGESPAAVEAALRSAHACLEFIIDSAREPTTSIRRDP